MRSNPCALRRLRTSTGRVKRILSTSTWATIEIGALFEGQDYYTKINRARFEELCVDLFCQTLVAVDKALSDAKMNKLQIHDIVLVGGSSRIPKVQNLLQSYFCGKSLNLSINPDEAVAYGAAIKAAILSGDQSSAIQDVLLVDVAPLSLGISTVGGVMSNVIERNSPLPCKQSKMFTTCCDNQSHAGFQVFEGERVLTKDNNLLGNFELYEIPEAPSGVPQLYVTFDLDVNGMLKVKAKEMSIGHSAHLSMMNYKGRLSPEDIQRMVSEAEQYAAEDEKQRQCIAARRQLENYVFGVKHAAEEAPLDKLSKPEKDDLISKCNAAGEWLDSNTTAEKEAYEHELAEFKKLCGPMITRIQGDTGPKMDGGGEDAENKEI